jgi:Protein of unknown function (DUF2510)
MTTTPAGWYPDPENAAQLRWWDGAQWTENRSNPAPASPYSTTTVALKAPEGTNWNTVWIWILVFLPYVSSLGIFAIDWRHAFDFSNVSNATGMLSAELSLITSPGYIFTIVSGLIAFGLFVWFSYLDWRELTNRGVPKPFHWAWGFLSVVYTIGRSVVVRRRTGRGISPMWVTIAVYVAYLIASFVFMGIMMATLFTSLQAVLPNTYVP